MTRANLGAAPRATYAGLVTVAVLLIPIVLAACGRDDRRAREVSLTELVTNAEDHDGQLIRVEGTVRSFGEDQTLDYWIEDTASNRVGVLPARRVVSLLGHRVVVVGRFSFDEDRGRTITVDRIESAERPGGGNAQNPAQVAVAGDPSSQPKGSLGPRYACQSPEPATLPRRVGYSYATETP